MNLIAIIIIVIVAVVGIGILLALLFMGHKKGFMCSSGQCISCDTSNTGCIYNSSDCSFQCSNPVPVDYKYGCYNGECVECDPSNGVPCRYKTSQCIPDGGTTSACSPGILGWKCTDPNTGDCENTCYIGEPSCLATKDECVAACSPTQLYSCNSQTGCCELCPDPNNCPNQHPNMQDCLNNCTGTESLWTPNSDRSACIQCSYDQKCNVFPTACTDYQTCVNSLSDESGYYCDSNSQCNSCNLKDPPSPPIVCIPGDISQCPSCCTKLKSTWWQIVTDSEGNQACQQCTDPKSICASPSQCQYTSEADCRTALPPTPWDGWFCNNGFCSQCLSWDPSTYPAGATCTVGGIDQCWKVCAGGYHCDPKSGISQCSADDPSCLFATEEDAQKVPCSYGMPPGSYTIFYTDPNTKDKSCMTISSSPSVGPSALTMVPVDENGNCPQPAPINSGGLSVTYPQDLHWNYDGTYLTWHSDVGDVTIQGQGISPINMPYCDQSTCMYCSDNTNMSTCTQLNGGIDDHCAGGYYNGQDFNYVRYRLGYDGTLSSIFSCPDGTTCPQSGVCSNQQKCSPTGIPLVPQTNQTGRPVATTFADPRATGWSFVPFTPASSSFSPVSKSIPNFTCPTP